jgi:uncharacterized membrane protein
MYLGLQGLKESSGSGELGFTSVVKLHFSRIHLLIFSFASSYCFYIQAFSCIFHGLQLHHLLSLIGAGVTVLWIRQIQIFPRSVLCQSHETQFFMYSSMRR